MSSLSSAARQAPDPAAQPDVFPYDDAAQVETPAVVAENVVHTPSELVEQARQQGRAQGQHEARAEAAAVLAREREQIVRAVGGFAAERNRYYRRVEGDVVRLALAIARKILHREVQLDPRALAGIVRVTLEGMDAGTRVTLHVAPREAVDWRHYFAGRMEGEPALEVREDAAIGAGECRIETSLGTTDVGFESQLKEIETGLLDLLEERPGR